MMALPRLPHNVSKNRLLRDMKEVMECKALEESGVTIQVGEHLREFSAFIRGPPGSPYEKASYQVAVQVPTTFPFQPPKIKFTTAVWHPNIGSRDGSICVDVLKEKWTPSMSLRTAMLSVQNLLENPDASSPQDLVVGMQMRNDVEQFKRTARVWAKVFGIGNEAPGDPEYESRLAQLTEMGVWKARALRYLSEHEWDLEGAVASFFPDNN